MVGCCIEINGWVGELSRSVIFIIQVRVVHHGEQDIFRVSKNSIFLNDIFHMSLLMELEDIVLSWWNRANELDLAVQIRLA